MSTGERVTTPETEFSLSLLAETLEQRAPLDELRTRLLRELRGPERWTQHASDVARMFGLALPDALEALRQIHEPGAWRPGFWPGSQHLITGPLKERVTLIARLPAGLRIPRHRHRARELTYILDGELIEDGRVRHGSGCLVEKPPESEHDVTVSAFAECLVVFSVCPG